MVTAKNPILSGFYPDPSICRVGEDYYLVTSSFVYAPGVPIFHSRDLAHWEQIGNILDRPSQLCVENEEISRGIFAPTIRYHEGTFYMITTNVSHGGNFIVTAQDPAGPWSDPYYLGEEAVGIDPSLFFDDDGRCYYCGTRPNPEGVRYNGDWEIWIQELDLGTMKLKGRSMAIWKGAVKGCIWPEGPHIYKINGYYYLMHAEGGTGPEHSITIARSTELFKWFEGCPRNPIFTHRNLGMDYPVIYAGHGDLVDDINGNWYVVMLASRPCKKHSSMGRETFIAKTIWENEWPVIAPGIGHLEDTVDIPLEECRFIDEISENDFITFCEAKPDKRLVGIGKRNESFYSLKENPGVLRLYTNKEQITDLGTSAFLGLRQKGYEFTVKTAVRFIPQSDNETAGLVLFQNNENHLRAEITMEAGRLVFVVTTHIKGTDKKIAVADIMEYSITEKNPLWNICMICKEQEASIWIGTAENSVKVAEKISLLPYTTEEAGGFVGCTVGMYASSNGSNSDNYAEFSYIMLTQ